MTEAAGTAPAPRVVPDRSKGRRRRHAAAATRLVVGGIALAGTFDLAAVMAAESTAATEAEPVAPPVTLPPTTVPPTTAPAPAPRTVVIIRRHIVTGNGTVRSQGSSAPRVVSSAPASSPAPAPVPATPAPAPAPAPVTTTKGS